MGPNTQAAKFFILTDEDNIHVAWNNQLNKTRMHYFVWSVILFVFEFNETFILFFSIVNIYMKI